MKMKYQIYKITNVIVSFYALRSRKAHHVDIYKDVVINNYIIK